MRPDLLAALSERVVVADGATGTMLQAADLSLDDFEGHEGCNEILNVTRPDGVATLHDAYFAVGADAVETNTFGANLSNLGEYGIADRIHELAEAAGVIASGADAIVAEHGAAVGKATIEAIAELKRRRPDVQTILGLSNISFGLKPVARVVLNSGFLAECRDAGLDAAIVHASRILPMARIPDEQREVALDLIYDRRRDGYDPLTTFLDLFEGVEAQSAEVMKTAEDPDALDDYFRLAYRGARYSFGYPACPAPEQQAQMFELLRPERVGVELSEEFQLVPEQSTSAIVAHHPDAKHFAAR